MTARSVPPLRVAPDLRARPWAGARLAPAEGHVGEAWLAGPASRVLEGPMAGRTLDDLAADLGADLVGSRGLLHGRGGFPVLVKLIDTDGWLSVQVHPDDAQALELEGAPGIGKAESWLVLDAGPRAELLIGRDPAVAAASVRAAIGTADLPGLLHRVRPRTGDRVAVPAGMLHALGPDLLIFEIQQPSDITYRAWDWGRTARETHVDQARRVVDAEALGRVDGAAEAGTEVQVAASSYYRAHLVRVAAGAPVARSTDGSSPHVITTLAGEVELRMTGGAAAGVERRLGRWETVVLGASAGRYTLATATGTADVVVASVP